MLFWRAEPDVIVLAGFQQGGSVMHPGHPVVDLREQGPVVEGQARELPVEVQLVRPGASEWPPHVGGEGHIERYFR